MNSFKLLLEKFDKTLRKYNLDNYKKLQPPLPENEINNYLDKLGIQDENFKYLFSWKNGFDFRTEGKTRTQMFDFGILLTLQYILECRKVADYWKKTYIPLISTNDGDWFLFNNKKGSDYGKIHLFSPALLFIDDPISYYDSIPALVETTIKAYEEKILVYNSNKNWLDEDVEQYYELAKRYNKKSNYWKLR